MIDFSQPDNSIAADTSLVGRLGEEAAAKYLVRLGFRLVLANFKVPVGRNRRGVAVTGEIDLIALDRDVLCFVEVKTRSSDWYASPLAAINLRKQRQIIRTARIYRRTFNISHLPYRYDAVSVVLESRENPRVELFKNYWTEEKFRKKAWHGEIW